MLDFVTRLLGRASVEVPKGCRSRSRGAFSGDERLISTRPASGWRCACTRAGLYGRYPRPAATEDN